MKYPIEIKRVPHGEQRYDTAGDYGETDSGTAVRISQLPDSRYEWLVLVHELVEMILTKHRGIPWEEIDRFDTSEDLYDPGDDPRAPYHTEHRQATEIERQLAAWLGVDWAEYDTALASLQYKKEI